MGVIPEIVPVKPIEFVPDDERQILVGLVLEGWSQGGSPEIMQKYVNLLRLLSGVDKRLSVEIVK